MCVTIITSDHQEIYNINKPLEEQIFNNSQITVEYESDDQSIPLFMQELSNLVKKGANPQFDIKVLHNNNIFGARVKKEVKKLKNDININELIKIFTLAHKSINDKLEQIAEDCMVVELNVK